MNKENAVHKRIRESLLLKIIARGLRVWTSHGGDKDIRFYKHINGRTVELAQPDILIENKGAFLAIEIENSLSPKHLLGVAFAVHGTDTISAGENVKILGKPSCLIVVPSISNASRRSRRPGQIAAIKELVKADLDFPFFDIISEDVAFDAISRWSLS